MTEMNPVVIAMLTVLGTAAVFVVCQTLLKKREGRHSHHGGPVLYEVVPFTSPVTHSIQPDNVVNHVPPSYGAPQRRTASEMEREFGARAEIQALRCGDTTRIATRTDGVAIVEGIVVRRIR